MKIGVNTRLLQEKHHTGIQSYIVNLYKNISSIDKSNEYVFLKGHQKNSLLANALYNNLLIRNEIKKSRIDVFHATNSILRWGQKPAVMSPPSLIWVLKPFLSGARKQNLSITILFSKTS